jgi:hypothetical protein
LYILPFLSLNAGDQNLKQLVPNLSNLLEVSSVKL